MRFLFGAASLIPIWILGALVLHVVGLRRPTANEVPLEFAVGVVILGVVGTGSVIAGIPLAVWPLYLLLVVLGWAAWWKGALAYHHAFTPPRDRLSRALGVVAVLVLLVVLTAAMKDRLSWDGWAIWTLKARILFEDGGLPLDFFRRPGPFDFAHPEYPLAVPLLDWWMFRHAGGPEPALASFAGGVWLLLVVSLLWSSLQHRADQRLAAAAALGVAAFWPIGKYATGGTADVVITLALLGAVIELEQGTRQSGARSFWRAGAYLTLAALAKNEGVAAAVIAILVGSGWMVKRGNLDWRRMLALSMPLVFAGPWLVHTRALGLGVEQIGGATALGEVMERMPLILAELGRTTIYRSWMPLPFLVAVGLWTWYVRREGSKGVPWALLGGYVAAAIAVYLTTDQDLAWLLETSLRRILSGTVPAAVFLTVLGCHRRRTPSCISQWSVSDA